MCNVPPLRLPRYHCQRPVFIPSLLSFPWTHPSNPCSFVLCILLLSEEEGSPWLITRLYQSCAWRTVRLNFTLCRRICSECTCQPKPFSFELTRCKNLGPFLIGFIKNVDFFVRIVAFLSLSSDKLRWISALSRPHPKIDFSAAQGEEVGTHTLKYQSISLISSIINTHLENKI